MELVRAALFFVLGACAPVTFDVAAQSHAVLAAYDRGDATAVGAVLAPGFVHFEGGSPHDRAALLARTAKRAAAPPSARVASRTFSDEHAVVAGDDATYIGRAAERGGGSRGGYIYDGYYTLGWHREHGAWRLATWTYQRAGEATERDTWDDIFTHDIGFEHAPNKLLVSSIADVSPGDALDVLMGQGRNALYLASRGWRVTGVDWSSEGIARAQAEAKQHGFSLATVDENIAQFDFGTAKWDLVTLIYAYAAHDAATLAKIRDAIRPGGLVVIEYFPKSERTPDGFAPGALRAAFAGFDVLRDEVVVDMPDWAEDAPTQLVRFVAKKR